MRRGRKLAMLALSATAMVLLGGARSYAQSDAPDPSMLLNLDLFTKSQSAMTPSQEDGGGESMWEQIRALRAMGYLDAAPSQTPGPPPYDDRPVRGFAPGDDWEREP